MSLAMIGAHASYEFRWRRWALLRDAVTAHLEGGEPGSRYPRFASIGEALGTGAVQISAGELAAEIDDFARVLADHPIEALVLGPVTAAVLYPGARLDAARPLSRLELKAVAPVADAQNLREYFASMIESMRDVCAHPAADGTIEIVDG